MESDIKIAALFVQKNGVYFDIPGVDPWDEERDARIYNGPWPVVAHPPCARWGRYWSGGPSNPNRLLLGDDGGCFLYALCHVQVWGGVLEHPAGSKAWDRFGLTKPKKGGGWIVADDYGYTCQVDQGHYGHRSRKPTWLYAVRCVLPELIWTPAEPSIQRGASTRRGIVERMCRREREATPAEFRDILIRMARSSAEAAQAGVPVPHNNRKAQQ